MLIYIIWLVGVILWNFGFPNAPPIADVADPEDPMQGADLKPLAKQQEEAQETLWPAQSWWYEWYGDEKWMYWREQCMKQP